MSKQYKRHARFYAEDLAIMSDMGSAEIKTYLALRYCSFVKEEKDQITAKCEHPQTKLADSISVSVATIKRGLNALRKRFKDNPDFILSSKRRLSKPAVIELSIRIKSISKKPNLSHTEGSHVEPSHMYSNYNNNNNSHLKIVKNYFDSEF